MPKKSILMEIESLVNKNNELFDELTATKRKYDDSKALVATLLQRTDELQKEIEEKNGLIASLEAELEALKSLEPEEVSETLTLETKACETVVAESIDKDVVEIYSSVSAVVEPKVVVPTVNDVDYGAAVELASSAIGEVVLECTELCAFFAENGGSNAKDLINLALGRTEVFKGEALSIVEELSDTAAVVTSLNEKKSSTLDYFAILKKQV